MVVALSGQFAPSLIAGLHDKHDYGALDDLRDARRLDEVDVLVTRGKLNVDQQLLASLPRLKLIIKAGSGLDNIDLGAARQRAVTVARTGGTERSVAELAMALLFGAARRVPFFDASVRCGRWGSKEEFVGRTLAGARIGLLGFGAIGREVALMSDALGMTPYVFDRSLERPEKQAVVQRTAARACGSIGELMRNCDVISLHIPLGPGTEGIVGAAELAELPTGAILINTARAGLVDRAALYKALASGRLGAAGLDVHYSEHGDAVDPIVLLPNVVSTPHIGAQTSQAHETLVDRILAEIAAHADGAPLGCDA